MKMWHLLASTSAIALTFAVMHGVARADDDNAADGINDAGAQVANSGGTITGATGTPADGLLIDAGGAFDVTIDPDGNVTLGADGTHEAITINNGGGNNVTINVTDSAPASANTLTLAGDIGQDSNETTVINVTNGTVDFRGDIEVAAGTVTINAGSGAADPTVALNFTVATNENLAIAAAIQAVDAADTVNIVVADTEGTASNTVAFSQAVGGATAATAVDSITVNADTEGTTATFAQTVNTGTLSVLGDANGAEAATATISGTYTAAGVTTVTAGSLANSNATLNLDGAVAATGAMNVTGGGHADADATVVFSGATIGVTGGIVLDDVTGQATATFDGGGAQSVTATIDGAADNEGAIIVTGASTNVTFNSAIGATNDVGTLTVNNDAIADFNAAALFDGAGALNGTSQLSANNTLEFAGGLTGADGTIITFDGAGAQSFAGAILGESNVVIAGTDARTFANNVKGDVLTVGDGTQANFDGTVEFDEASALNGTGQIFAASTATFTGGITGADGSTITFDGAGAQNAVGAIAGNSDVVIAGTDARTFAGAVKGDVLTVGAGTQANFNSTVEFDEASALNGTAQLFAANTATFTGGITGADGSTITFDGAGALAAAGAIAGDADITIAGTDERTFAAAVKGDVLTVGTGADANFNGAATFDEASTLVGTADSFFASTTVFTGGLTGADGTDITFDGAGAQTFTGVIAGDANITTAGTDARTFANNVKGDVLTVATGTQTDFDGTVEFDEASNVNGTGQLLAASTVTFTGGVTGADGSTITLNGAGAQTFNGAIAGSADIVTAGTDMRTFAAAVAGDTLTVGAGTSAIFGNTAAIDEVITLSGTVASNNVAGVVLGAGGASTLTLNNGATLQLSATQANGGVFLNADAADAGSVVLGGAGAVITVNTTTTGLANAGEQLELISAAGGNELDAGVTAASFDVTGGTEFNYTVSRTAAGIILTAEAWNATNITAAAGGSLTTDEANTAVTAVGLVEGSNLEAAVDAVFAAGDQAVADFAKSATVDESIVGSGTTGAALDAAGLANDTIDTAAAEGLETGLAAGDHLRGYRAWLQAFGAVGDQDERDGAAGFDTGTVGAAAGVDRMFNGGKGIAGLAFSYAFTNVESDAVGGSESDINSYMITAYADHKLPSNFKIDGRLGFALNDIETDRAIVGAGVNAQADYNSYLIVGGLGIERDYPLANGFTVTPRAGVEVSHLISEEFTETGAGVLNTAVGDDSVTALKFELGGRVQKAFETERGAIKPFVSAFYVPEVLGQSFETTAAFTGGGTAFDVEGFDPAQHEARYRLGVEVEMGDIDVSASYDGRAKSDFIQHGGQIRVRWAF